MSQDRTLPLGTDAIYYIDTPSAPGTNCLSLEAVMAKAHSDYEGDAYIYIYKDVPEGTEVVYRGYAKDAVTPFESFYMDAALGNRFNS